MNAPFPEGFPLTVQMHRARRIMEHVAHDFDVTVVDMRSQRRAREVAQPRQVAWHITRELTPLSLPQIGHLYNKDHTSILSGLRSIGAWMFAKPELRERVERLIEECRPLIEIDPAVHEILTRANESVMALVDEAIAADPMRLHRDLCRIASAIIHDAGRPALRPGDETRKAISQ